MATVTLDPWFTLSGSGLNLKFWMVMLSLPPLAAVFVGPAAVVPLAAGDVVLVVDDDFLSDDPQPAAPSVKTATAMTSAGRKTLDTGTSEHPARHMAPNTSCCGDRGTAGG